MKEVKYAKGFKIVYLNIRSVLNHLEELENELLDGCFDVVILGETWLHASVGNNLIEFESYKLVRSDRQITTTSGCTKRGGGLCVYVKQGIQVDSFVDDIIGLRSGDASYQA